MSSLSGTPPTATATAAPQADLEQEHPDVAFGRDRSLGLVAATSDDTNAGLCAAVLRHFGFSFDHAVGLWRLPAQLLWVDQVLAAAQASTLLAGLGRTVVADEETRTTALALAAQHPTPTPAPGATLVQYPAHRAPAPHTPAPPPRR